MRVEGSHRTKHSPSLVLGASLFANVICDPQEDGHIVLDGVLARVEPSDDGETTALVDVATSPLQLRLKHGEREAIASDGVSIEPKLCSWLAPGVGWSRWGCLRLNDSKVASTSATPCSSILTTYEGLGAPSAPSKSSGVQVMGWPLNHAVSAAMGAGLRLRAMSLEPFSIFTRCLTAVSLDPTDICV